MGGPDLSNLSLSDLQARKRELKQQLKQYDMNFARRHGRMPVKAEKEPIRHLYENYNALKSQIGMLEIDGRHAQQSSPGVQQQPSNIHSRNTSPASSTSSGPSPPQIPQDSLSVADDTIRRVNRNNRRSPPPVASSAASGSSPSQELSALRAEKGQLHQMLRAYEKDFLREHRRQVSSFADIRPVASQYRRYKEIKRAIASLQQGGG